MPAQAVGEVLRGRRVRLNLDARTLLALQQRSRPATARAGEGLSSVTAAPPPEPQEPGAPLQAHAPPRPLQPPSPPLVQQQEPQQHEGAGSLGADLRASRWPSIVRSATRSGARASTAANDPNRACRNKDGSFTASGSKPPGLVTIQSSGLEPTLGGVNSSKPSIGDLSQPSWTSGASSTTSPGQGASVTRLPWVAARCSPWQCWHATPRALGNA
jgi:hypothetical protein